MYSETVTDKAATQIVATPGKRLGGSLSQYYSIRDMFTVANNYDQRKRVNLQIQRLNFF
jgi:hypothetical protein